MFYFDTSYLLLVLLPTLVLSGLAQWYVSSAYSRWSRTRNSVGLTGAQVAQAIFQRTGLRPVPLEAAPGELSDHYDPGHNVVRLSRNIATVPSVAAMAVAAHELGHVQQYQTGSFLIQARSFLLPAVRFSPMISYGLIMAGFLLQLVNLLWLGVIVFGISVVFMVLTLPVELDASRRALILLREAGLLQSAEDERGARNMLTAAATTYLAAAMTSVLTLLYYISLIQRSSRN